MEVKLTTLTPVHVGNGTVYNRDIDFVRVGNEIGIIDENKVLSLVGSENIHQWVGAINKGRDTFLQLLKNRGWKGDLLSICSRICKLRSTDFSATTLKEHYRTSIQGPCIPGSSIKGSIRTAIFNHLADENFLGTVQSRDLKNGRGKFTGNLIDEKLFGKSANERSTRFLKVGDAMFGEIKTQVFEMLILDAYREGWAFKPDQMILAETIPAGSVTSMNIKIDELLCKRNIEKYPATWSKKMRYFEGLTWNDLCCHVTNFTRNIVGYDYNNLYDENFNEGQEYLESLDKIYEACEQAASNEMVLRVGGFSGYLFTTGQWVSMENAVMQINARDFAELRMGIQRRFYPDMKIWPKTRKTTEMGVMLGFIKISGPNEDCTC